MEARDYLNMFFATRQPVADQDRRAFRDFCNQEQNLDAATQILSLQDMLMKGWKIKSRVDEIINQHTLIPNGSVNKPYTAAFDFDQLQWLDIIDFELDGLQDSGLTFSAEDRSITGTPVVSGDLKILFRFRIEGEENPDTWNEKVIPLVINPDPKSLWKDIASEQEARFWKPDEVAVAATLGDLNIVVASKRGRSHANVGSFRDDDFAFEHFGPEGWSVVALSDGAGSAQYSREGSRLACASVISYFSGKEAFRRLEVLDELAAHLHLDADPDIRKEIASLVQQEMGDAARHVFAELQKFATQSDAALSDFHATLIFVLIRKMAFGHLILSFGVGDCPIGIVHNGRSAVTAMNTLDVGEFGGGTRFITMPEIFRDETFARRASFALVAQLDYLVMMSDGIYDPKFEVESNLSKIEKWQAFLADLGGENADGTKVIFDAKNKDLPQQLSTWMDFWSPGNHDDRTLAVVF